MGENWIIPVAIGAVLLVLVAMAAFWMMSARSATPPAYRLPAPPPSMTVSAKPGRAMVVLVPPKTAPGVASMSIENGTVVYVDAARLNAMPGLTQAQKDWLAERITEWDNGTKVEMSPAIIRPVHVTFGVEAGDNASSP
jgi:hypothetical protein